MTGGFAELLEGITHYANILASSYCTFRSVVPPAPLGQTIKVIDICLD